MKISNRKNSIFMRLLLPMAIVAALQSLVFMVTLLQSNVLGRLEKNSYAIMSQQVQSRAADLDRRAGAWSNLGETALQLTQEYNAENDGAVLSRESSHAYLKEASAVLVALLRVNKVNGAYLVLTEGSAQRPSAGEALTRYGVCIRDMDPDSGNKQDADLLVERAPSAVVGQLGLALDSWWESNYTFTDEAESDYYFVPAGAKQKDDMQKWDYRYWSKPYRLSGDDSQMISCSVPLFTGDGAVFAVLGIEMKTDYLEKMIPSEEVNAEGKGVYALAAKEGGAFTPVLKSGYMASRYIEPNAALAIGKKPLGGSCHAVTEGALLPLIAGVQQLNLVGKNAALQEKNYYLLALADRDVVLRSSNDVRFFVFFACAVSLGFSLLGAFVVGKYLTKPIKRLAARVRKGVRVEHQLESVNIAEIDDLIDAIQTLNRDVNQSRGKTADIIHMSGLMVGTFEVNAQTGEVFADREFYRIMGGGETPPETHAWNAAVFEERLAALQNDLVSEEPENGIRVYCLGEQWVKFKISKDIQATHGIVMDVTAEMLERQKIVYERDHDLLTGLLNRRAFHAQAEKLFAVGDVLKSAAMVMMDVDNLKYVNDSFGHDCGDTYLKLVGGVLEEIEKRDSLVARISGDEFLVFFYGADCEAAVLDRIDEIKKGISDARMSLPGGEQMRVRVSGGIAWYPQDSKEPNSLIKFADFAMLQSKRHKKGSFGFFNIAEYRENRYLVESVDEIYRMIENQATDYFFQPIVNVRTGEIHAYEALMRPYSETIKSPAEALSLARAAGCLYHLEVLTWNRALEKINENLPAFGSARLFINSIPNQRLNRQDFLQITGLYKSLLQRVVVEITEEERSEEEAREWFRLLKEAGIEIAIDDYGSGYNGQVMLLDFNPGYVKVDMSIVRGVTEDLNRQEVISALVRYGAERGIKIIAEGVETREELKCLIGLGIEYVQGFVLQRPKSLPEPLDDEALAVLASVY